jgi:hypothetical protein
MNREIHVRFCEGLGVQLPWATHLTILRDTARPRPRNRHDLRRLLPALRAAQSRRKLLKRG